MRVQAINSVNYRKNQITNSTSSKPSVVSQVTFLGKEALGSGIFSGLNGIFKIEKKSGLADGIAAIIETEKNAAKSAFVELVKQKKNQIANFSSLISDELCYYNVVEKAGNRHNMIKNITEQNQPYELTNLTTGKRHSLTETEFNELEANFKTPSFASFILNKNNLPYKNFSSMMFGIAAELKNGKAKLLPIKLFEQYQNASTSKIQLESGQTVALIKGQSTPFHQIAIHNQKSGEDSWSLYSGKDKKIMDNLLKLINKMSAKGSISAKETELQDVVNTAQKALSDYQTQMPQKLEAADKEIDAAYEYFAKGKK